MKKIFFCAKFVLACFILISISSCSISDNSPEDQNNKIKLSKEEITSINTNIENIIKKDLNAYFGGQDYKIANESSFTEISSNDITKLSGEIKGPFNGTMQNDGILQSDVKVILDGSTGGYAYGVYFCDIGRYSSTITLPNNTTGWIPYQTVTNLGYKYVSTQELGFNYNVAVNSNGATVLNINTYYIKVKYNMLGQYLGGYQFPAMSSAPSFTYFYMAI